MVLSDDQRGYVRVAVDFPIQYRVADPNEPVVVKPKKPTFYQMASPHQADILENAYHSRAESNGEMLELLMWLDWKVNYLIKLMTRQNDDDAYPKNAIVADLSASGMRILASEAASLKQNLHFQMILPIVPFTEMHLVAEVIRCNPLNPLPDSGFGIEMGLEFQDMRESDREVLIRYVLNRQMELQRLKRK